MATPRILPGRPPEGELVTKDVLSRSGLNAQAFTGAINPTSIWRFMAALSASAFPYYREIEAKDIDVGSALDTRRLLGLARAADVKAADEKNALAVNYADAAAAFLDAIPAWRSALEEMLRAPAYGFVVLEVVWKINGGGSVGVEKLIGRPQELFSFGRWLEPQTGELRLASYAGGQGELVPPRKFLVLTSKMQNGDRRGQPLLRDVFWASWFSRNALKIDLSFLEKPAGTVVIKYPSGASDDDKKKALEAAQAINEETAVAVPESFTAMQEFLYSARTRTGQDYSELLSRLQAQITRRILGQTLTTQGSEQGRGTMALGQVHEQTQNEIIRSDVLLLEQAVNELVGWWGVFTFGAQFLERDFRPYWRVDKDPPEDASQVLDRLAKAQALGAAVTERDVYEGGQVTRPEEGEAVLEPARTTNLMLPGAGE